MEREEEFLSACVQQKEGRSLKKARRICVSMCAKKNVPRISDKNPPLQLNRACLQEDVDRTRHRGRQMR